MFVDDIRVKLDRACQHVDELDLKVEAFLNEEPNRTIVDCDEHTAPEFRERQRNRVVTRELSVITGEVIYFVRCGATDRILVAASATKRCSMEQPSWCTPSIRIARAKSSGKSVSAAADAWAACNGDRLLTRATFMSRSPTFRCGRCRQEPRVVRSQ